MLALKFFRANITASAPVRRLSSVSFNAFGAPSQVLSVGDAVPVRDPKSGQAVVKLNCSPVTYEDLRSINGLSFNCTEVGVGGMFGVGKVTSVGEGVTSAVNSQVLFVSDVGAWNDEALVAADSLYDVASLSAEKATLVPDVASAWAILNKYTTLSSGDIVARTTGGSAVFNQTVDSLCKQMGCSVVVASDAELLDSSFKKKVEGKSVKLAISHHAGRHARGLSQVLADGAVLVTHNGAIPSIQDCDGIDTPVAKLIFNGSKVCGFDFAAMAKHDRVGCTEAVNAAVTILAGDFAADSKIFPANNFKEAVERASKGQAAVLQFAK